MRATACMLSRATAYMLSRAKTAYMSVLHIYTALNSSDNLPSYTPDNHHSSDDIYWRGEGELALDRPL